MEKGNSCFAPDGAINLSDILENLLAVSTEVKCTPVTGPSKYTHMHIPAMHTYVHQKTYLHECSEQLYNSAQLETAQMSIIKNSGILIQQNKIQLLLHEQ